MILQEIVVSVYSEIIGDQASLVIEERAGGGEGIQSNIVLPPQNWLSGIDGEILYPPIEEKLLFKFVHFFFIKIK